VFFFFFDTINIVFMKGESREVRERTWAFIA